MSKAKHKTVEKWVAWLHRPFNHHEKVVRTLKIEVVDTGKQYRIEGNDAKYREATAACGYRHLINKSDNIVLHDSELAALRQMEKYLTRQEQMATAKANDAQENLSLINEALATRPSTLLLWKWTPHS